MRPAPIILDTDISQKFLPQPPRQVIERLGRNQGASGLLLPPLLHPPLHALTTDAGAPIHLEFTPVMALMQRSRGKSRQSQCGWAAQAAMGDQHPTGLTETLLTQLQIEAYIIDGNATAASQKPRLQRQAEQ